MRRLIGDSGEGILRHSRDQTLRRGPVVRRRGDIDSLGVEDQDFGAVEKVQMGIRTGEYGNGESAKLQRRGLSLERE